MAWVSNGHFFSPDLVSVKKEIIISEKMDFIKYSLRDIQSLLLITTLYMESRKDINELERVLQQWIDDRLKEF